MEYHAIRHIPRIDVIDMYISNGEIHVNDLVFNTSQDFLNYDLSDLQSFQLFDKYLLHSEKNKKSSFILDMERNILSELRINFNDKEWMFILDDKILYTGRCCLNLETLEPTKSTSSLIEYLMTQSYSIYLYRITKCVITTSASPWYDRILLDNRGMTYHTCFGSPVKCPEAIKYCSSVSNYILENDVISLSKEGNDILIKNCNSLNPQGIRTLLNCFSLFLEKNFTHIIINIKKPEFVVQLSDESVFILGKSITYY